MSQDHVLIAGGGIGGLVMALSLHQIGVPCTVYESARAMRPMGVGINIQPNAVRELFDLGITGEALDAVGLPALEWALVGLNGADIYAEPRGLEAGYHWPQYAVHRGDLLMLLYDTVCARLGADAVQLGAKVTGYSQTSEGVSARITHADGTTSTQTGCLLIGADGIHSNVRAQMHPEQPPIHWGGMLMWRGTVRCKPLRSGSSFIGLGKIGKRVVLYPISHPDADGMVRMNWIAEIAADNSGGWQEDGWFKPVEIARFIHHFDAFRYDWLDFPALLERADGAFENPMIDRDPIPTWVEGRVALMGDAAHAMYPTGSNGASQAIVDSRVMTAKFLAHGLSPAALHAYDDQLCAPISELVLRNRGDGPFGLLTLIEQRCGGEFDNINDVIPPQERTAYMAKYKAAAGFAIQTLNAAAPTVPPGAKLLLGHVDIQHMPSARDRF